MLEDNTKVGYSGGGRESVKVMIWKMGDKEMMQGSAKEVRGMLREEANSLRKGEVKTGWAEQDRKPRDKPTHIWSPYL